MALLRESLLFTESVFLPLTVKISVDTLPILQLDKAEENVSLPTPEVVLFHGTFTLDPVPEIHDSSPVWGPLHPTLTSPRFPYVPLHVFLYHYLSPSPSSDIKWVVTLDQGQ